MKLGYEFVKQQYRLISAHLLIGAYWLADTALIEGAYWLADQQP